MRTILLTLLLSLSVSALAFDFSNIDRVSNNVGADLDFNFLNNFDFNGDGVNDQVRCNTETFVSIRDGHNGSLLFSWDGPLKRRTTSSGAVHTRTLSGCEIVEIDGKPVIILSNFWNTEVWRAGAPQYLVYKVARSFVVRDLEVQGFGQYLGVARSIKCGQYPNALVRMGYRNGALCFIAEYTQADESRSALLKLELNQDGATILAKDLSPTSDLLWAGGVRGTSIWGFPVGHGFASNQRDGGFMMDSAFMDFNRDGLTDFATVGQHAKLRIHKMVIDRSRREGVRFTTQELTSANSYTDMTEFLRVSSFNKLQPNLNSSCLYFSGEHSDSNGYDHIRCFRNGSWIKYNLPINIVSRYYNAVARTNGSGDLILKTRNYHLDNSYVDITFSVRN
jgi:hypothetical protein